MDILKVAKRAKVSTATVSRVINGFQGVREKTSAKVRRAISALNYVPNPNARSLRVGRTRLFGMIVSDINNPFFPELMDAFESIAVAEGIEVIFTDTNYDPVCLGRCIRRMIERNVDAIAVMTSEMDEASLQQAVIAHVPLVLMNQRNLKGTYMNIRVDYSAGFRGALDHLHSLGHRDIGFISGPPSLSSAASRMEAFLAALKDHHLRMRKGWMAVGDMRVEGGRMAMQQLLSRRTPPTAMLISNDMMAVGALQAARAASVRVPEDLSIIGFDDLHIAGIVYPTLSTIRHPRKEMAARAFASLQQALLGEAVAPGAPLEPQLVVRESTCPPAVRAKREA